MTPRSTRAQTRALAQGERGQATEERGISLSEQPPGEEPAPPPEEVPEEGTSPESDPNQGSDPTAADYVRSLQGTIESLIDEINALKGDKATIKNEFAEAIGQVERSRAHNESVLIDRMRQNEVIFMEKLRDIEDKHRARARGSDDHGSDDRRNEKYGPVKLRLEGCPRWPSQDRNKVYPFHMWAEDFLVWAGLLGYATVIKASPTDHRVSAGDDAIALRYIVAGITNPTVSTYVAQTFEGRGRRAWEYLNKEFGLPSLTQEKLRETLSKMRFSKKDDPRLSVMSFDRVCARLSPPLTPTELSQTLLGKIPPEYRDIASTIEVMLGYDLSDYDGPKGVRELYKETIAKRQALEDSTNNKSYDANSFQIDCPTGPETNNRISSSNKENKNPQKDNKFKSGQTRPNYKSNGTNIQGGSRPPYNKGTAATQGQKPTMNKKGFKFNNDRFNGECLNCGQKGTQGQGLQEAEGSLLSPYVQGQPPR